MSIWDEVQQLKKERRLKHKELTIDYDENEYAPKLREIQSRCQHPGSRWDYNSSGTYGWLRCVGCGKLLESGEI